MSVKLTPQQKMELEGKGFAFEFLTNVIQNRRPYWDPKSNSWTAPLPADKPRMARYLRKGFMLEKPPDSPQVVPPVEGERPGEFKSGIV